MNPFQPLKRINEQCSKWNPFVSVFAGLLGIIIAYLAIIESRRSTAISAKALAQTEKAIALQESEFRLRNRPYLTMRNAHFEGKKTDLDGVTLPHTIAMELRNISEIPANNVVTKVILFLNDRPIRTTTLRESGCANDDPKGIAVSFSEEEFKFILNPTNLSYAVFTTTYSGMLGEPSGAYTSVVTAVYRPIEETFGIKDLMIK